MEYMHSAVDYTVPDFSHLKNYSLANDQVSECKLCELFEGGHMSEEDNGVWIHSPSCPQHPFNR